MTRPLTMFAAAMAFEETIRLLSRCSNPARRGERGREGWTQRWCGSHGGRSRWVSWSSSDAEARWRSHCECQRAEKLKQDRDDSEVLSGAIIADMIGRLVGKPPTPKQEGALAELRVKQKTEGKMRPYTLRALRAHQ